MANELLTDYLSGRTVYFILRNATGLVWNGASFVAYATINYALYPITAAEQGTASGFYQANMPAVAAGLYYVVAKERAGVSPAESDVTVGTGRIDWSGSAAETLSSFAFSGTAGTVLSGTTWLAPDSISGQFVNSLSGAFAFASLNSGQRVLVYSGQLSGQPVNPLSGVTVPLSGLTFVASGPFANASLNSGQSVNVYSGQLSGQPTSLLSGNSVLVYSGMLSGQPVTAQSVADKSGYVLGSGGLDLVVVESGMNFRQAQAVIAAGAGGQLSGVGTGTIRIAAANVSGGPLRITGQVTSGGNRTTVVLNLPS